MPRSGIRLVAVVAATLVVLFAGVEWAILTFALDAQGKAWRGFGGDPVWAGVVVLLVWVVPMARAAGSVERIAAGLWAFARAAAAGAWEALRAR